MGLALSPYLEGKSGYFWVQSKFTKIIGGDGFAAAFMELKRFCKHPKCLGL